MVALGMVLGLAACAENPFLPDSSRPSLKVSWLPASNPDALIIHVESPDNDLMGIQGVHSYGADPQWRILPPRTAVLHHEKGGILHQFPWEGTGRGAFYVERGPLDAMRPPPSSDGDPPTVVSMVMAEPPRRDLVRIIVTATDTGPAGLRLRDRFFFRAMDKSGNPSRTERIEVVACGGLAVWTPASSYGPQVVCQFGYEVGPDRFEFRFNPAALGEAASAYWGQPWILQSLSLMDRMGNSETLWDDGSGFYVSSVRGPTSLPVIQEVVP